MGGKYEVGLAHVGVIGSRVSGQKKDGFWSGVLAVEAAMPVEKFAPRPPKAAMGAAMGEAADWDVGLLALRSESIDAKSSAGLDGTRPIGEALTLISGKFTEPLACRPPR